MSLHIIGILGFFFLGAMGLCHRKTANRLFPHTPPGPGAAHTRLLAYSRAVAAETLKRALNEPDRAKADAMIRQAIRHMW